jgi:uncharacterized protein
VLRVALLGALFGFVLSRVGATEYDAIQGMFMLTDLHLAGVIGVAVVVLGAALAVLRRRGVVCESGCARTLVPKPMRPGLVAGSLVFGAGWALTGTCPGTALAQIGEGRLVGAFTVLGILAGAALYGATKPRSSSLGAAAGHRRG